MKKIITNQGKKTLPGKNLNWKSKKADELFTFAQDAAEKFNTGGLEDKRYILSMLGSNLIILDRMLRVNLEERLIPMKEASRETRRISDSLEPIEGIDRTLQLESSYSQNPTLLRDLDNTPILRFAQKAEQLLTIVMSQI